MRTVAAKTAQVSSAAHSLCIFLDDRIGPVGLSVCRVEVFSGTRIAGFRHDYCGDARSFRQERQLTTPQRQVPTVITLSSEQVSEPSRRLFCAHACQAASLVAVSALLPACGGGGDDGNPTNPSGGGGTTQALPVINATVSGRTVSVSVSGSLANPGSAALVQASSLQPNVFLVFRDSTTAFTVLTAVCTHEGCTVDSFNGQLYTCPCHGSRYTTAGGVANGPANRALQPFASTLSGTTLTFNV